jgi:hypothetical protein
MVGALGFEDARLTWPQVAHKVRRAPRPSLAVVIDLELKVATATYTHAEVGRAASSGRLTKVVALGPRIAEVAEAYDRVLATLRETVPARTR